jgi:type VI secretion system (T6SS) effector Hcp
VDLAPDEEARGEHLAGDRQDRPGDRRGFGALGAGQLVGHLTQGSLAVERGQHRGRRGIEVAWNARPSASVSANSTGCQRPSSKTPRCSSREAGRQLNEADLTLRKAGGPGQVEFLKIKMTDCLVSSYQVGGNSSDAAPEDQFSIEFQKVDYMYTVARTGEVVETAFDFSFNPTGG